MCKVLKPPDMIVGMKVRFTKKYCTRRGYDRSKIREITAIKDRGSNYWDVSIDPGRTFCITSDGRGSASKIPIFCLAEETSFSISSEIRNNDGRDTCIWCGGKIKRVPGFIVNSFYDVCVDCGK